MPTQAGGEGFSVGVPAEVTRSANTWATPTKSTKANFVVGRLRVSTASGDATSDPGWGMWIRPVGGDVTTEVKLGSWRHKGDNALVDFSLTGIVPPGHQYRFTNDEGSGGTKTLLGVSEQTLG